MLKKYKNELLLLIEDMGYSAHSFKPFEKEVEGKPAFILQLINSPMFFMVRTSSEDYHELDVRYIEFGPGYPKSDYLPEQEWGDIDFVKDRFHYWLKHHVGDYLEEIDAPDMWAQINGERLFELDPNEVNRDKHFNKVEKEKINEAISVFSEKIKLEFNPTNEQLVEINSQLEYLAESVDRLDRFDWQGIALSTIISISIALSLDNSDGKALFQAFRDSFTFISGLIGG